MKLENLKIGKQINIYLGAVLLIVVLLLGSSLFNINSLWLNTEDLYDHPLQVRGAVGEIKGDVLLIHREMRQLPIERNQQEIDILLNNIVVYEDQMQRQIDILYDRYLGPKENIDDLVNDLSSWKTIRNETIRLIQSGDSEKAAERVISSGVGGLQVEKVLSSLQVINDFAVNRADEFYKNASENKNQIIFQMITLCIGIIFTLYLIAKYLRKGILPPLEKLTNATMAINRGELNTRIQNGTTNEFGDLARSFNSMAEKIQKDIEYRENAVLISSSLFKHNKLGLYTKELLKNLLNYTDSQMAAIYFLNEGKNQFDCYESIGGNSRTLVSFSAEGKEGEFGKALVTKKIQHLVDIPSDAQVIFSQVSGEYRVKEIITMPIVSMNQVIAVISLSSIKPFSADAIRLVNGLINEITASTVAVLSSQRILEFSQKLQSTNTELEQQAKELSMQADELTEQNIELEMQKKQLDQASRLKTNFISNMSHELRTPLNSVIALSGVLSRRLSNRIPDEELSYLEIISRNGKNLLTLINDILDISRIEAGHEETNISSFDVGSVISGVVEMLQAQAEQQKIALNYESTEEVIINSDMKKFTHILQNLVSNAVKFTEDGSVDIKVMHNDNNLQVIVADTGIGISEEHIDHIFDEFRQADGSTSRRYGGTGLGLAISKKYANLLGGTINVKSTPDVGSEFMLELPLNYEEENAIEENNTSDVNKYEIKKKFQEINEDLSRKTILLVEDNESSVIQVKDLIENLGCKVQVARDAKEALAIIEQGTPDGMILDLMMPEVDGFKLLEILRNEEATAHVPVLILTAKHITKDELKFLKRNNVHQFIQKGDVKRMELQQAVTDMFQNVDPMPEPAINKIEDLTGKPIILVVEDNPDNMTTVRALLEDKYRVLEAVNANEGIELINDHSPNLILMDIALPDMNGIEAFLKIRKTPQSQHIPVIALTASVMKEDREAILSYGFDAFIGKPIIESEFFQVINEVLYGK